VLEHHQVSGLGGRYQNFVAESPHQQVCHTDTCRTGGKFFYISDVAKVNGSHKFSKAQAVRSFMFGDNNDYARRPRLISSKCVLQERSSVEATSTGVNQTTNEIDWTIDASSSSGGLSANWSELLP
jgi:hypothetical protein